MDPGGRRHVPPAEVARFTGIPGTVVPPEPGDLADTAGGGVAGARAMEDPTGMARNDAATLTLGPDNRLERNPS